MIELPPSNLREYDLIWEGDSALKWETTTLPEPELAASETEQAYGERADVKAYRKQLAEVTTRNVTRYFAAALETGNWSELLQEGEVPTLFRVRQVPGDVWDAIETWRLRRHPAAGEYYTMIFRAAVIGIKDGPPGVKVTFDEQHKDETGARTGIGKVLSTSVTNALRPIAKQCAHSLGIVIAKQRGGPEGK